MILCFESNDTTTSRDVTLNPGSTVTVHGDLGGCALHLNCTFFEMRVVSQTRYVPPSFPSRCGPRDR